MGYIAKTVIGWVVYFIVIIYPLNFVFRQIVPLYAHIMSMSLIIPGLFAVSLAVEYFEWKEGN